LSGEEAQLKFKTEIFLLLVAIVLFTASASLYSYEAISEGLSFALELYPYRGYAISFVGFGSVLMVAASISYSKRSKNSV
jgi:hypothetical protein